MMVQHRNIEISEKEIEGILCKASVQQKKQMDAEGIFASEELIAATMQKLGWAEENAVQQTEKGNLLRRRMNYGKQLGRIALLAAAVLVIVLAARSGIWLLYNSRDSKEFDMDGDGTFSSGEQTTDDFKANGFEQNNVSVPEDMTTKQLSMYGWNGEEEVEEFLLDEEEGLIGSLTESAGIKPRQFYGSQPYSALKAVNIENEALQIVFDYPQDFLYACGREDGCFYLLATRRMPSGGYVHQLLSFDFVAGEVKTMFLPEETAGLISWISLQDGNIAYECEE